MTAWDGINWSGIAINAGNPADFFMSLTYGNGMYILSARRDGGPQAIIYRSATAANNAWTASNNALSMGETVFATYLWVATHPVPMRLKTNAPAIVIFVFIVRFPFRDLPWS